MPTGSSEKRKYGYIVVSLVILIFGIIFIPRIVDRLKKGNRVVNDRMSSSTLSQDLQFIVNNGVKRKVPEFRFLNQDSVWISNSDYLGKVYIAEFFFTTCPTICPIMTRNLVELQNTFDSQEAFGVASFTINPRYDTPEVLSAYADRYEITDPDWNLMTGDQDKIYQLATEGFYVFVNETTDVAGGFEHSGMFALIDKEGYLRCRTDGFGNPLVYYRGTITEEQGVNAEGESQQITWLKEDINKLLNE